MGRKTPTRRRPAAGAQRRDRPGATPGGPAETAGWLYLDGLGRVTSDRIEAAGGHVRAFAPRPGVARAAITVAPATLPGDPGQPLPRSVAERVARYAIRNRAGRLTGPQLSRLMRDWDTAPRDGETHAGAAARARAELQRLARLAWAEHVKAAP